MRYISGIEINKVRYIYLYLHTIAMMVIYHSDLYVLKDQIYILVNIQCNESRDIINLKIIEGSIVDFKKELIGNSFVINNPKATSSCGCGLSFSV